MSHYRQHIATQLETVVRVFSKDIHSLPKPILRVILAMGLFSFGWGPADALLSIYLSSFTDNVSVIGFLRTLGSIGGVVVLLPMGDLLDRVRHDMIIRAALMVYVLIGVGYFIAGEWLLFPLLIVTMLIHGTISASIWAAAEATLRDQSTAKNSSLVFGLHATVFHTLWAISMIIMVVLADVIPIHYTFILVSVMSLVSLALMSKPLPDRHHQSFRSAIHDVVIKDKLFVATLRKVRFFPPEMWLMYLMHFSKLALMIFTHGFMVLLLEEQGASIAVITGFVAVATIPFLFSFIAAEMADRTERLMNIGIGYVIIAITLLLLGFNHSEMWHIFLGGFFIQLGAALINPSVNGIVSMLTPKEYSGEGTAMLDLVKFVSITASSSIFGIMIGQLGWLGTFEVLAVYSAALVALVMYVRVRYRKLNKIYHINHPDSKKEPYIL